MPYKLFNITGFDFSKSSFVNTQLKLKCNFSFDHSNKNNICNKYLCKEYNTFYCSISKIVLS
jgi:hypothetical protein